MGEIKLVGVEKLKQIKNENEAKGVSAGFFLSTKNENLKKNNNNQRRKKKIIWLKSGSALSEDWGK